MQKNKKSATVTNFTNISNHFQEAWKNNQTSGINYKKFNFTQKFNINRIGKVKT